MRSAVQNLAGEDRQQHGVGIAHQADQREQQKDGADRAKGPDVVPPFAHLFEHAGRCAADLQRLDPHHQQGCDHGKVADAIDQEAPAFAEGCDHQAGDGRADEPRAIGHGGIDGNGVAEVVRDLRPSARETIGAGHVEGIDQALQRGESDDFPEVDDVRERERGQGE